MRKHLGLLVSCVGLLIVISIFWGAIRRIDNVLTAQFSTYDKLNETHQELKENYHNLRYVCDKVMIFQKLLTEIDYSDYNQQTNNCYDHSKALQKKLAAAGIKSSIAVNKDRTHAWVMVWVESTRGTFMPATNTQKILELRDENLEVILN
jgi:hypothetical protein